MGSIFELPKHFVDDGLLALTDAFDAISKPCTLILPPVYKDCVNCSSAYGSSFLTSRYTHGGPMPFSEGAACPMCNGSGQHAESEELTINLVIHYKPKEFAKYLPENFVIPEGSVVVKGKIADLKNMLASRKIVLQNTMENYINYAYEMSGEPFDMNSLIQNKFWYALFKRVPQ